MPEVREKLSVGAARRRAKVSRPSLAGLRRIPVSEAGLVLARGGRPPTTLMAGWEDFVIIFAPPRSGKTGLMSAMITGIPGPVLTTSTRTDVYSHTVLPRSERGPVLVLNPGGEGGIPTSLRWDLLQDCHTAQGAIGRAGYLMAAAPKDSGGKDAWWDARGAELLRYMLHAAAISGATMREADRWVRDPLAGEPRSILAMPDAAAGWLEKLEALTASDSDQLRGITASAAGALAWMDDPHMASVACPERDDFDAWDFLTSNGTVYLIGTDRPHNSAAPFFACFTAHLFDTAKLIASASPGGRLDPPLGLVIDEPAITCPVPLAQWSAEAGGHGITLVTGFQSPAQLTGRWGADGGRTIRDNASVQLIMGGYKDPAELEALSAVCGMRDTWDSVKGPSGKTRTPRQERLYPPEQIRTLAEWRAVLLHRSARPLTVKLTPVWEQPGYERAPEGYTVPKPALPQPIAAIEAPRPAVTAGSPAGLPGPRE